MSDSCSINDTYKAHGITQQQEQYKKRKKQNNRSNSMFEWSLSNHDNMVSSLSNNLSTLALISSYAGQDEQYRILYSNELQLPEQHQKNNKAIDNHFSLDMNDDDEKRGLSPIKTTALSRFASNKRQRNIYLHKNHNLSSEQLSSHSSSTNDVSTMQMTQYFLFQFVKAFVSCGAPSHRLDHCTHLLLHKWNMSAQIGYFPGFLMISFEKPSVFYSQGTSSIPIQFIKVNTELDIHRLIRIYQVFEDIMMDERTIQEATNQLDYVMKSPPLYSKWLMVIAFGVASSTSMPLFFYGGWLDMIFGFGLGVLVAIGSVFVSQRITRFAGIFDVLQCAMIGFFAAAASSRTSSSHSCFYALSVGGVVSLLPGFTTLVSMLEIASGTVTGTLRLTTTLVYSLLLGFGLAIGASGHQLLFPQLTMISYPSCENTLSPWTHVLLVPFFTIATAITLRAHWSKFGIMLVLALVSHGVHYLALLHFVSYPHLATTLAAFVVAMGANIYARMHPTVGFVDMITGLFFLVPGSVGVSSTLDTFGQAVTNAASSPSNNNAISEMSIILNAGHQGILFAVHIMVITVSVSAGLVLAALVIYPLRKLLDRQPSSTSSSSSSSSSSVLARKTSRYRKRDWIGEVTF
ncbi:uncharacterized protein BX664DRAFT_333384 [Halteromyces radiatus]|uniref:uncharacterized protein n=1 Tax=Halteromyces radiatus TaxID=101107 RepID=UPI00221E62E1|nr:uncharacterized protein BX664DRAFT_333384 [Halteromyces radiatus]KAI8089580.1 hypothetical protein BX664DRAFT_333384 [Halteromyces radiatus]